MRGRRGNQVADFLTAFNQTLATVDKVGEGFELAKIANEKPVESTGFTADQGAQLEAAAKTGQYDIGYDQEAKAYTVTPKSDPSKTGMVSMQGVTDFMGNRTAGRLDESQVNNTKLRAMAGVVGKSDPMQGARLLREVTQGERDDQRFKAETANSERSGKMADLQLRAAEEAEKTRAAQRDFTESFAGVGWSGLPALYERYNDGNTVKVEEDGKGGATLTQIGADGKVVGQQKYGNRLEFYQDAMARFDPAKWAEAQEKREATARTQANADRTFGLEQEKAKTDAKYKNDLIGIYGRREDTRSAGGSGKAQKLDQDDLERVKSANSEVKRAEELVVQSMKDLQPGDDPNKMPGVQAAKKFLSGAKTNRLKIGVQLGTITPTELANDVMGSAKSEAEVFKSLQQLHDTVGPEVAERVAALVQNNDVWKQMVIKKPGANPAPSISGALGDSAASPPVGRAGTSRTMTALTAGDKQLQETAAKAGYSSTQGKDGAMYFRRSDGQGPFITDRQLTKMLNLGS